MSQTVDAMGKQCPIPVVMARQALQGMQTPDTLVVLVDNEVAVQNLTKLAGSCHLPVRAEKLGDKRFEITMDVAAPVTPSRTRRSACRISGGIPSSPLAPTGWADGEEALGKTLLKGFLYAVSQLPSLPQTILFYNTGARITCSGSDSLEDLKFMEAQGVEILTCGTCLDYYKLKETLAVGGVTNMYVIAEKLSAAGKVIKP